MDKILTTKNYWNTDHFNVVESFPQGGIVWNIGRRNFPFPGFIPVSFPLPNHRIDRNRLFAVKCKDEDAADKILKEAGKREINFFSFTEMNK